MFLEATARELCFFVHRQVEINPRRVPRSGSHLLREVVARVRIAVAAVRRGALHTLGVALVEGHLLVFVRREVLHLATEPMVSKAGAQNLSPDATRLYPKLGKASAAIVSV